MQQETMPAQAFTAYSTACDGGFERACAKMASYLLSDQSPFADEAAGIEALTRSCRASNGLACAALCGTSRLVCLFGLGVGFGLELGLSDAGVDFRSALWRESKGVCRDLIVQPLGEVLSEVGVGIETICFGVDVVAPHFLATIVTVLLRKWATETIRP